MPSAIIRNQSGTIVVDRGVDTGGINLQRFAAFLADGESALIADILATPGDSQAVLYEVATRSGQTWTTSSRTPYRVVAWRAAEALARGGAQESRFTRRTESDDPPSGEERVSFELRGQNLQVTVETIQRPARAAARG